MFSKFQYSIKVPEISSLSESLSDHTLQPFDVMMGKSIALNPHERNTFLKQLIAKNSPVLWIYLEEADHDPGRFWLKLVATLRKHVPDAGEKLLAGLIDHHAQPMFSVVKMVTDVIHQKNCLLVLENIHLIESLSWWQSMIEWLIKNNHPFNWIGITLVDSPDANSKDLFDSKPFAVFNTWNVFWLELLSTLDSTFCSDSVEKLVQNGFISFSNEKFIIPNQLWFEMTMYRMKEIDSKTKQNHLEGLASWLFSKDEWLEGIRILLHLKEYERAGYILEQNGENWLEQGFDRLEMVFWLREIPGVLLESRPVLCWLAAKACKDLNLKFLMSYYINHAENSLTSFMRFSRNHEKWLQIEINEDGLRIGTLMQKLNQLKN